MTEKKPLYLEDLKAGSVWQGAPIPVTADDIISFGRAYDPQPFHTDPVAAASGPFGALVASGWFLAARIMRQFVESNPLGSTPLIGMGVDDLRWLKPVRAGDVLTVRREILEARRSATKPDRGIVRTLVEVRNQRGEIVMKLTTITQVPAAP